MCSVWLPNKANPISIVDSNAVLSSSISLERFQPVSRRNPQVNQVDRRFNLIQLAEGDVLDRCPSLIRARFEELLRFGISEALNHNGII
jgi:hypothetical protein